MVFWVASETFSTFWWPSVELYGHMHLPKIMFLLPSKSKYSVLHSLSKELNLPFFFYGGHFELSKCLSVELYLRWASLICCPKHQREICKSLKFELCTVPIFLIWSLSSRLVYWSIHFSFPTHEKYVTITGTSIFELWTQWTPK